MKHITLVLLCCLGLAGCGSDTPTAPAAASRRAARHCRNSLTFTATTGQFLYISAQIDTSPDSGSILVSVTKNGALVQSATAVGFPNIGSASGTF